MRDEAFQAFDTFPHLEITHTPTLAKPLDETYDDHRVGLFPWEQEMIDTHFSDCRRLLLIAAGGGREMLALLRRGFEVEGIDFDEHLVAASNRLLSEQGFSARIRYSPRFTFPVYDHLFDGAIVCRKFISYVHDRKKRIAFLEELRGRLAANSPLLLSYFTRQSSGLGWRLNVGIGALLRTLLGNRRQALDVGDHLDPEAPVVHHHFTENEIRDELVAAGFSLVQSESSWFGRATALADFAASSPDSSLPLPMVAQG